MSSACIVGSQQPVPASPRTSTASAALRGAADTAALQAPRAATAPAHSGRHCHASSAAHAAR